jgi:hypothetical protein
MEVFYYINNIEIEPPLNAAELSIELNFDKDDNASQAISINEWEFGLGDQTKPNDAARLINAHLTNGLLSGVGALEGIPFRIELTEGSKTYNLLNGYLDTSSAIYECDMITISSVEAGNIDWLNDVAGSIYYRSFYNNLEIPLNARITDADFISIPYVLSELPNNREAFMAAVSLFMISTTLATQLSDLTSDIAAGPVGNVAIGAFYLKVALRAIYITGLIITVFNLVKQLINLLIQPIKYHDGMKVTTLCEKASSYFGFTFESSILYSDEFKDMVIIPKKYSHDVNKDKDNILGFLKPNSKESVGYYNGTFKDLLTALKEMFNGKIIIENKVLKFEREDYPNSAYNYIIPARDDTDFRLNFDDFNANYTVEFLTDTNDKNTLQRYDGVVTTRTTTPKKVVNKDMVLMKGGVTRSTTFARCTRKVGLTLPEEIMLSLANIVDSIANRIVKTYNSIIKVINKFLRKSQRVKKLVWNDLADAVKAREHMLTMENDFIDIAKIGIFDIRSTPINNDVSINDATYINSEFLYNNYHFLRTFVVSSEVPNGNQKKLYGVDNVKFCFSDYELLRKSNFLQDDEGRNGELISCTWNVEQQNAELEYFIREAWTANLKDELKTLDGK